MPAKKVSAEGEPALPVARSTISSPSKLRLRARNLRIVSLLPSATEIAYALGLGDDVAAVTDGCDHPADARTKPVVSRSRLTLDAGASAGDVDGAVREAVKDGEPLYAID